MKTCFRNISRCICILIIEQLREPMAVFWSLTAPVAYLALSTYQSEGFVLAQAAWVDKIAAGLAYVAITMSLFTFGMYLVGRRESGFVRSFLTDTRRRTRFILAQYLASVTLVLGYGAVYGLLAAFFVDIVPWETFVWMYCRFAAFAGMTMFGAILVGSLPMTFQAASSFLSIFLLLVIVSGLVVLGTTEGLVRWISPMFLGASFISGNTDVPSIASFVYCGVMISIGLAGIAWQRINPEWSNR